MGGYIPEEILENIRLRADIVQVISEYVNLQKKGKNYVGPCPFHQESDPSFTVTPDKQIFYCFGCNKGGNVFKFIMLQHNLSFPEAVRLLGERVGVAVPDGYSPRVRARLRREEKAWKINALAGDYFHSLLLRHPAAAKAREYLAGRGLTPEIIRDFNLGYALPAWDDLIKFMQGKGVGIQDLLEVGLAVEGERKAYDRFRDRLMFPICDSRGRVVGFGGRVLGEGVPKYLNTAETAYFSKSKILYGLNRARSYMRELGYAIITEGYMDTIAAHQFGISNAVASLGTSLTQEHGRLLMNYTREVIIAYDADAAGVAAAVRGLDILQQQGFRVRVLALPEGKDPDEFLRARGPEAWKRQVENAVSLVEYKLQVALEKYKNAPSGKEAVLEEVLPTLAVINGELEKNEAVKLVAARLYTSYHVVAEELRKFTDNQRKKATNPDKIVKNKHNINIRKNVVDFGERAEYGLLRLMLEDTDTINIITDTLPGNFFKNSFCRGVFAKMLEIVRQSPANTLSVLLDYLDDEYQQRLSALLMEPLPGDNLEEMLHGFISAIKRRQLMEYRHELQTALTGAEKSGNLEEIIRILREIDLTDKTLKGGKCCNEGRHQQKTAHTGCQRIN
ncbi:DNA primase [Desulfoscipio geothermicus]|uniref:DNA primase n=1 Tax=Desulfoscipio geothermicus DSM 3669 TaxID=1121426 RepID=A0A1I6D4E0_9FIRM|nr:DNA primase [Desulfoscipio geothermicus]SFR00177.1 DNA primase [Desulfoscipio geothermicus DSM 3669]